MAELCAGKRRGHSWANPFSSRRRGPSGAGGKVPACPPRAARSCTDPQLPPEILRLGTSGSLLGSLILDVFAGGAARSRSIPGARSLSLQPPAALLGAFFWRTSPGSGDDSRSDPCVRRGLKYCHLMRGGVGQAASSISAAALPADFPGKPARGDGCSSVRGERVKCPGKAGAASAEGPVEGLCRVFVAPLAFRGLS